MKSTLVALFCISVILCSLSVNIEPAFSQTEHRIVEIERMVDFLTERQFNETLGLCREAPNVAPNTYWLVSDNLWAWKALTLASKANLSNSERAGAVADKIESSLKNLATSYHQVPVSSSGLPKSYCHEAVLGEAVQQPYRTATNYQINRTSDYELNITVCDGSEMTDWYEYADRLLVGALSSHWQGDDTSALNYFSSALNMWNTTSQGLQDKATSENYAVYKLALLLYTSKVLAQELPFEQTLIDRLYNQQQVSGGITTDYYATGTPNGDANTETTAVVLIALLTPVAMIPETPWIFAIAGLAAASTVAAVVIKRPFENFPSGVKRQPLRNFTCRAL